MAYGLNSITLTGAITTEHPELTTTSRGTPMLRLSLSGMSPILNRDGTQALNNDGQPAMRTYYRNVTLFGRQAETLAAYPVSKGTPLLIKGRLAHREWTTTEGEKRESLDVRPESIHVLDFAPSRLANLFVEDARGQYRLTEALNRATLIGHLVHDADMRQTKNASVDVLPLRLAVPTAYRDHKGELHETTAFIDVTAWRDLARDFQDLPKGQGLYIEGHFNQRRWETQEGTTVYQDYVEATTIEVLRRTTPAQPTVEADAAPVAAAPEPAAPPSETPAAAGEVAHEAGETSNRVITREEQAF